MIKSRFSRVSHHTFHLSLQMEEELKTVAWTLNSEYHLVHVVMCKALPNALKLFKSRLHRKKVWHGLY